MITHALSSLIEPFDRIQLQLVRSTCRRARSLSDAGRTVSASRS